MPPILFPLQRLRPGGGALGVPPYPWGSLPLPDAPAGLHISGVTYDSTGAILGGCTVHLLRTIDDVELEVVTSDAVTGAYSFSTVGLGQNYYVVAYKPGSPDLAGTTVNTLQGS